MAVLSFTQIESVWAAAGGNPAVAVMAASVAEAESSGNTLVISPQDDVGLWQINVKIHTEYTTAELQDALTNAKAAIAISDNGTNWRQWCTAYTDGACGSKGGVYDPTGASPSGRAFAAHQGAPIPKAPPRGPLVTHTRTVITNAGAADTSQSHLPQAFHALMRVLAHDVPTAAAATNRVARNLVRIVS